MENQPLGRIEYIKFYLFIALLGGSVIFVVGIIPALLLVNGFLTMRSKKDFSKLEVSAIRAKRFFWLLFFAGLLSAILAINNASKSYDMYNSSYAQSEYIVRFVSSICFSAFAVIFVILINILYVNPLSKHSLWVERNGIFKEDKSNPVGVNFKESYLNYEEDNSTAKSSVANEISKLVVLKNDGYITDEEFKKAKSKILSKD